MKIYLAGPMQGYPEFNFPEFRKAAQWLRDKGYTVFSPVEKDEERHNGVDISKGNSNGNVQEAMQKHSFSLRHALADDTRIIALEADTIAMLPGWENSKGAFTEWALARALNLKFIYLRAEDYAA